MENWCWRKELLAYLAANFGLGVCGICVVVSLTLCYWASGFWLDCQPAVEAHFCAVRLADGSGASIQWGERQRTTVWVWGPDGEGNRRVWPFDT